MFQAKLEISELAYLLHALKAKQVIGIDQEQVFPVDSQDTDSLLSNGLEALKKHGWLVPDGRGFNMSIQLTLIAAVVAQPEQAIIFTRRVGESGKHVITYYQAENIIVELFFTADQHYLLTQLSDLEQVNDRICQDLRFPEKALWEGDLIVDLTFLEQIKRGEVTFEKHFQSNKADEEAQARYLQQALQGIETIASLDVISRDINNPSYDLVQFVFLQSNNETNWILTTGTETATFLLRALDKNQFTKLLQRHFIINEEKVE